MFIYIIYIYIYIYVYIYEPTCTYICMYIYIYIYIYICVLTHINMYTYLNIYKYLHLYTHIYIYICMCHYMICIYLWQISKFQIFRISTTLFGDFTKSICSMKVGLEVVQTNLHIEWNPVYKAF